MTKEEYEKVTSVETIKQIDEDGNTIFLRDEVLHNEDGPAFISADGTYKAYFLFGELHRTSGPAIESVEDGISYFVAGQRHNPVGPAIVTPEGKEFYFYFGFEAPDKEIFHSNFWRKEIKLKMQGVGVEDDNFDEKFQEEFLDKFEKEEE